jgi:hypothetical protein
MSKEIIEGQVKHLGDRHTGQTSQRRWTPDHDNIGLAGEHAVGAMLNQYPYIHDGYDGDEGYDFMVGLAYKLDVKTSQIGILYVQEDKVDLADIYVACSYDKKTGKATPVGWMLKQDVKTFEITDPNKQGKPAHTVPHSKLRPMSDLLERLVKTQYGEKQ